MHTCGIKLSSVWGWSWYPSKTGLYLESTKSPFTGAFGLTTNSHPPGDQTTRINKLVLNLRIVRPKHVKELDLKKLHLQRAWGPESGARQRIQPSSQSLESGQEQPCRGMAGTWKEKNTKKECHFCGCSSRINRLKCTKLWKFALGKSKCQVALQLAHPFAAKAVTANLSRGRVSGRFSPTLKKDI